MSLEKTVKSLPDTPGVYQYFDAEGRLLYVGKAKSLIKRVKSYFRFTPAFGPSLQTGARIRKMLKETASMSYIVVKTEHDALILENSLIKQLKPKYNILLRDDKTYPYIYIDHAKPFPRFEITRKIVKGEKIEYFGPFSVAARDILDAIYELFPLVQKSSCLRGGKTCLFYQMRQCLGPCEGLVSPKAYAERVDEAKTLITDKKKLTARLGTKMHTYAEQMRFEEAVALRDRIERIDRSESHSNIDLANRDGFDVFAVANDDKKAAIVRLFVRRGKIVSSAFDTLRIDATFDRDELYERTLLEYYGNTPPPLVVPILLADDFESRAWVERSLGKLFRKKAHIYVPTRGEKRRIIDTARLNAAELLTQRGNIVPWEETAKLLQALCGLLRMPVRIETFDNSHLAGEAPVGAMVVFNEGAFDKKSYRHYRLDAKDEYAQMRETLTRRIESFGTNPPPDLWVLDGGSTLLALARDLLDSAGVNLDVVAISKEKIDAKSHRAKGKALDRLHTFEETFELPATDKRLQWVQRLRDEAHRFAITFHKKSRDKAAAQTRLLELKGISPAKVKKLLNHFGTFEAIYAADEASLSSILNRADAHRIKSATYDASK